MPSRSDEMRRDRDSTGHDEYRIMTRIGDGQWERLGVPWEPPFHLRRSAEDQLTVINDRRTDDIATRQVLVNTATDPVQRSRRQDALDTLRATEYRIFYRRVPGFTPLP